MRLFGRKQPEDEVARCPRCGEPIPEGAVECMMCGVALLPLRGERNEETARPPQSD